MNINSSYSDFYDKIKNNLNSFSLLDNFNINKRNLLIEDAKEVIHYIIEGKVTNPEQIDDLKKLTQKLVEKSKGGPISNFFLNCLGIKKKVEDLKDRSILLGDCVKKINKLLKANVGPDRFPQFLSEHTDKAQKLEKIIFEDHIYERMVNFNHNFTYNDKGEVTFKYTERTTIDDEIPEDSVDDIDDPETYWDELYQEFTEKGFTLEIRGEFDGLLYMTVPVSGIDAEKLKEILIQENGDFNKSIKVIYPTQVLTMEQLEELGVLEIDDDEYVMTSKFQYLENGFTDYPYLEWEHLRPYAHTDNPPKQLTIDIIVHSKPGLPGVFSEQGHASVKITTPQGEIYSLGFYPEDVQRSSLGMQKGQLMTPDNYLFMPSTSYEKHVMTYTLSDPKAFHKLVKWIEAVQGYHEDQQTGEVGNSNLFYHPTHQSCASFAATFRDFAIGLGAKSQKWSERKISNWTKLGIKTNEFLMNFSLTSFLGRRIYKWDQGFEHACIKNYNITHLNPKGLYLPVDLILDHQNMTSKLKK